jgi:anti-anti-sigma factor
MPPDSPGARPGIDVRQSGGGVAIVALRGEFDLSVRPELAAALERACAAEVGVVVDLSGCAFIDSTVIAVLLASCAALREQERAFALVVPEAGGVARTAQLAGLQALLPTFTSLDEALRSARAGGPPT